jgi:purine-binding chemotaxis protein CheW
LCRLGRDVIAVDLRAARGFVRVEHVTPVPGAEGFLGVMNVRGRIVPVADIRPLLGLAAGPPLGHGCHALVVQADSGDLAIVVEEILGLEPVSAGSPDEETVPVARIRASYLRADGSPVSLLVIREIAEALRARPATAVGEGPV